MICFLVCLTWWLSRAPYFLTAMHRRVQSEHEAAFFFFFFFFFRSSLSHMELFTSTSIKQNRAESQLSHLASEVTMKWKGELCCNVTCEILTFPPLFRINTVNLLTLINLTDCSFGKRSTLGPFSCQVSLSGLFYGPPPRHTNTRMDELDTAHTVRYITEADIVLQEFPLPFVLYPII